MDIFVSIRIRADREGTLAQIYKHVYLLRVEHYTTTTPEPKPIAWIILTYPIIEFLDNRVPTSNVLNKAGVNMFNQSSRLEGAFID
jgi:hypothetical protein